MAKTKKATTVWKSCVELEIERGFGSETKQDEASRLWTNIRRVDNGYVVQANLHGRGFKSGDWEGRTLVFHGWPDVQTFLRSYYQIAEAPPLAEEEKKIEE